MLTIFSSGLTGFCPVCFSFQILQVSCASKGGSFPFTTSEEARVGSSRPENLFTFFVSFRSLSKFATHFFPVSIDTTYVEH